MFTGSISGVELDRSKVTISEATMPSADELVGGGDSMKYLWVGMSPTQSEALDSVKKVKDAG